MKKWALLIFLPSLAFGQFRVGGWYRNDALYADGSSFDALFTDLNQLKLTLEYKDSSWRILGDVRLNLLYGYGDIVLQNPNAFLFNRSRNHFALAFEAPRLYFRGFTQNAGNFTLGRTYLNFGQPQLFNTLEWYKNFDLIDPTATKPGINILSWDRGLGAYGAIKAFIGADDTWEYPLAGLEIVAGLPRFEISLAYQYKGQDRSVLGLSFKIDILLTFFGTYAAHLDGVLTGAFSQFHDLSLGFDYSFLLGSATLLLSQIFYYNSAGARPEDEIFLFPQGDYYYRALGYSYSSVSITINQFIQFGASVLVSLRDGSGAVLPTGRFTLANNLLLDAVLGIYFGRQGGEFSPSPLLPNAVLQLRLTASF